MEKSNIPLPKIIIERVNGVWEVYDTENVVVLDVFSTEEEAKSYLKQYLNEKPAATQPLA